MEMVKDEVFFILFFVASLFFEHPLSFLQFDVWLYFLYLLCFFCRIFSSYLGYFYWSSLTRLTKKTHEMEIFGFKSLKKACNIFLTASWVFGLLLNMRERLIIMFDDQYALHSTCNKNLINQVLQQIYIQFLSMPQLLAQKGIFKCFWSKIEYTFCFPFSVPRFIYIS